MELEAAFNTAERAKQNKKKQEERKPYIMYHDIRVFPPASNEAGIFIVS